MSTRTFTYKVNMDLSSINQGTKTMQVSLASIQGNAQNVDAQMTKLAETISKRYGVAVTAARDETKSIANAIKETAREANRSEKNFTRVTQEFQHMTKSVGMTTDELQILNAQMRLGSGATQSQKKQVADLVKSYQTLRNAANTTQGSMRGLRGQAQNVGWQLQDVAVQAQMGTNALIIIGQQGSQFASGFGPMGALIGAGIAVGSAAIGVLAPSLMKADSAAKDLDKTMTLLRQNIKKNSEGIYEFNESLLEASRISKSIFEAEVATSMLRSQKAVSDALSSIRDDFAKGIGATAFLGIGESLESLIRLNLTNTQAFSGSIIATKKLGKEFGATGKDAWRLGSEIVQLFANVERFKTPESITELQTKLSKLSLNSSSEKVKLLISDLQGYFKEARNAADMTKYLTDRLEAFNKGQDVANTGSQKWLESLRQQAETVSYTAVQMLNYERGLALAEASTKGATLAQIQLVNSYFDTIIAGTELAAQNAKNDATDKARDSLLKSQVKTNKNIVESLRQQADTLGYTDEQNLNYQRGLKLLQLATQGATQEQIDATNAYYDQMVAAGRVTVAEAELTKTLNARAKRSDSGKLAQLEIEQAKELAAVGDHQESIDGIEKYYARERIKINGDAWDKMSVSAMEYLENTDEVMMQQMDRLVSGFGNAMVEMAMGSKKPADALKDMFQSAIGSMVQFFAEWAAQKLILWALDKTLGAATATSHAGAMAANTGAKVAEAGLNAFTAISAIPIVGPTLAPKAAGAAIAATTPMAATATTLASLGVGMFDKGGRIAAGGMGIVSELGDELVGGTMVYNGSPNSLGVTGREDTARMRGSNSPVNITVNSSGNASPEAISRALVRALKRKNKGLDTGIYDSMNRGRTNRGKRFNA